MKCFGYLNISLLQIEFPDKLAGCCFAVIVRIIWETDVLFFVVD